MDDQRYCPYFHHTVELLGRRWTGVIVRTLVSGPARFCDIRDRVPGLSDRLLANRLSELETEGIVEKCDDEGVSFYQLTAKGTALEPVLEALAATAKAWALEEEPASRPGRIRTAS